MTGAPQGQPWHPTAVPLPAEQLLGMYLAVVTHTRGQDLWVKVSIPQVFGNEDSNWARPIGFNSAGSLTPPVQANTGEPEPALLWGGIPDNWVNPGQPLGWSATETGPGPLAGSLVVVLFLGGDRNRPGYLLTSQHVG